MRNIVRIPPAAEAGFRQIPPSGILTENRAASIADAGAVADAIVGVVGAPFGKRPFRLHIDPTQDGADVGFTVLDRVRAEMLHRVGLGDLLKPRAQA